MDVNIERVRVSVLIDDDEELLEDFREECSGALEQCEPSILLTEKPETFEEGYAEVFRAFHSIKGLSSMFGLDQIQAHFHFLESLLVKHKEVESFPPDLVDYLLASVDAATRMIHGQNVVFDLFDPVGARGEIQPGPESGHTPDINDSVIPIPVGVGDEDTRVLPAKREIIYVVDDEEDILDVYCDMLSAEQIYDVVPFLSAEEALKTISETTALDHPSVIISDLKMPGLDGKQFLARIKELNPDIPFVFLSGYLDKASADFGLAHGAYGVLSKPVKEVEFHFMVQSAVAFNRSQKLVRRSLKFLFYFLSQNETHQNDDREILKSEIQKVFDDLKTIRSGRKKAA